MPDPLDRSSPVPLYFQVAGRLQSMVDSGELVPGSRLPGEAELSGRLGVSGPTLRRAVSYLVEQGVLQRRRGAGTRVLSPRLERTVDLTSLHDDLARSGREPATVLRSFTTGPAGDAVAAALGIPFGTPVASFERLRLAGGEPLALMCNAVPLDVLRPRPEDLVSRGLYELLREAGRAPTSARQVVGARAATRDQAAVLDEPRGAPLLTMTRTAWDGAGSPVEYGSHVYRARRYAFELTLSASVPRR